MNKEDLRPVEIRIWIKTPDYNPKQGKLRTQVVVKGFFHTWAQFKNDDGDDVYGIVELENGIIRYVEPEEVKFLDRE